ncbi:hypothetical protein Pcinc_006498 [Petrolisthes cinctipes]|uniref:Uncharacterized protein n=1 Tax=Petrolisthes cinctipes TaxID=88211 RepID=A0AAE1GCT0_PETCI|nr:hypothetical protein Pcinc_006498 [Petrolisthes cinctipes]
MRPQLLATRLMLLSQQESLPNEAAPASQGVSSVKGFSTSESAPQVALPSPVREGTPSAQGEPEAREEGYDSSRDTDGDGKGLWAASASNCYV